MKRAALAFALLLTSAAGASALQFVEPPKPPTIIFQAPSHGALVVALADGEGSSRSDRVLIRYAIEGDPIASGFMQPPGELGSHRKNVTDEQIEDAVAQLEDGGIDPRRISAQRYRPWDLGGSPQAVVGLVSVSLENTTPNQVEQVYAAMSSRRSGDVYAGTWQISASCDKLVAESRRTADENAKEQSRVVALTLGLQPSDGSLQRVYRSVDPNAGVRWATDIRAATCAFPTLPINTYYIPMPSSLASAQVASLSISAYHAAPSALPREAVPKPMAQVVDFYGSGDYDGNNVVSIDPAQRTPIILTQAHPAVMLERADAWLVTLVSVGRDPSISHILQASGIPDSDVFERVDPQSSAQITQVRFRSMTRAQISERLAALRAASEHAQAGLTATHTFAFLNSCKQVEKFALQQAALQARANARSAAAATQKSLSVPVAVITELAIGSIRCGPVPKDVRSMGYALALNASTSDDAPDQVGSLLPRVTVMYEIR